MIARRLRIVSSACAFGVLAVGGAVLLGWAFRILPLVRVLPGGVAMAPNTAACLLMSALSLLLIHTEDWRLVFSRALGGIVAFVGLFSAITYQHPGGFDVDQVLFRPAGGFPEHDVAQMAFTSAVAFLFLGGALLLTSYRVRLKLAQWLLAPVALVALVSFAGYLYGARGLSGLGLDRGLAIHTAIGLFALSVGVLFSQSDEGISRVIASETPGGVMARRALPAVIGIPLALGTLRLVGERAGLYRPELGTALHVATYVFILTGTVLWVAALLTRADEARFLAAKAVAEIDRRFRTLIEKASDVIVVIDASGVFEFASPSLRDVMGVSPEEVLGKRVFEFIHPDDLAEARHKLALRLGDPGTPQPGEFRLRHKNGSWRTMQTRGTVLEGDPGGARLVLNARDVTESRRKEAALRDSEARYRDLFETSPLPMWIFDVDTLAFRDVNAAAIGQYGHSREEFLSMNLRDVRPPEDIALLLETMEMDRASGQHRVGLRRHRRKDGTVIHVEIAAADLPGTRLQVSLLNDVTERMRAEEALRESERRYREMFDASPLPKWVYDPTDLRILDVNRAAVAHYGFSREEFLKFTLFDLRPPEEHDRLREAVREDAKTPPKGSAGVWRHRKKDGTLIDVEVFTQPIVLEGEIVQLVVVLDVTDRRRLEEQFRHAQKMEAIGRLAGGIAHDFNNLLMVVQGIADVLPLHAENEAARKEDFENLRAVAQRGGALTKQLLSFSRQHVLQAETLDAGEVVRGLSPMIERLVGEDIRFSVRVEAGAGSVHMDPSQLEQVVMNLVVNARDAMPSGGRLSIEVGRTVLDDAYASAHEGTVPGPYVQISVSDSGTGMTPETRKKIFEPFFTTKEPGKGTGLGLATVYTIVKGLKGNVWAYSEPGHGSVFKVFLPPADDGAAPRRPTAETVPVRGSETILVVEDEATIREMTETFLSGIGYRVLTASDGDEGLRKLGEEKSPIHVVVTDVVLPGPNGREIAKAAVARDRNTRVIFMSGHTDDPEIQKSVATQGFDFLQKPFPLEMLAGRIRAALDSSS